VRIASVSTPAAIVSRLVDEPASWPFFTAYQLELSGRPGAAARWVDRPKGVFQQLVVLSGEVELIDAHGGSATLTPTVPAFIPATLDGGYQLASSGVAKLLVLSVPGLRGGFPHV
jgi:hypothetical protein